ncbi:MAG TPA: hypothetical protein VG758_03255 [Hyphomicrobiaceae bacterium]|nr:hypothetical protein [Hyphomicrobiaceae bacterium]
MTPTIHKSDRIRRSVGRWGLLAAILCVGSAALTGYAAGRDVSRSLEYCIFTVPTVAIVIGLSWLLIPIVAEVVYRRQERGKASVTPAQRAARLALTSSAGWYGEKE